MAHFVICSCGTKLRLTSESAGKTARCPKCGEKVAVPPMEKRGKGGLLLLLLFLLLLILAGGVAWFWDRWNPPSEETEDRLAGAGDSGKPLPKPPKHEKEKPQFLIPPFDLEPVAGPQGQWTVRLKEKEPGDKKWTYQFRTGPKENWQPFLNGFLPNALEKPGKWTVEVRAVDPKGNASPIELRSFIIRTRPTVAIAGVDPANPFAGGNLSVQLKGDPSAKEKLRFQFKTNAAPDWQPAPEGRLTLAALKPGPLHLDVRAVDDTGIASPVVTRSWTVVLPLSVAIGQVLPAAPKAGDNLTVQLTGTHLEGEKIAYQFRTDSKLAWRPSTDGKIALSALKPGLLTLEVRGVDGKGRSSAVVSRNWNIAAPPPPVVAIVKLAPAAPKIGEDLTVYLKGSSSSSEKLIFQFRTHPSQAWQPAAAGQFRLPALKAGPLKLEVRVVDGQGIASAVVAREWLLQPPLPTVEIAGADPASPLAGELFRVQLKGTHPSGDKLLYQYRTKLHKDWQTSADGRFTLTGLKPGPFTLEVRAVDDKGLSSQVVTRTWTVQRLNRAPSVKIAQVEPATPKAGGNLTILLKGTDPDGDPLTYQFRLDPKGNWQNAAGGRVFLAGLKPGKLALEVRVVDNGGLSSSVLTREWTLLALPDPWKEIGRFDGHTDWVLSVAFLDDGRRVVSGSRDKTVRIWSVETGKEMRRFPLDHDLAARTGSHPGNLILSPHGKFAASTSRTALDSLAAMDTTIRLWDVETGKRMSRLEGHAYPVTALAFSADGGYLLSTSGGETSAVQQKDSSARWWQRGNGKPLKLLEQNEVLSAVALSPDGKLALTSSSSTTKAVALWNLTTGRIVRPLPGHAHPASHLAFSPNGSRALSYSAGDKMFRLWDLNTGKKLRQFSAEIVSRNVLFSPDGKRCLAGCADKAVRFWDLENGRELLKLSGHTEVPLWVAFSADGRLALSGGADHTIRLWGLTKPVFPKLPPKEIDLKNPLSKKP